MMAAAHTLLALDGRGGSARSVETEWVRRRSRPIEHSFLRLRRAPTPPLRGTSPIKGEEGLRETTA